MNFYIDFEATQFSNNIISIGCVTENGETFRTLVKPGTGEKLTNFIKNLTGITDEDLRNAPTADDAFNMFYEFVKNNTVGAPRYYCYGSSDREFIKHTVEGMRDFQAIVFATSIMSMLIDYSITVKSYMSKKMSLAKVIATIRNIENVDQTHDALDDAMMLKECHEGLTSINVETTTLHHGSFEESYRKIIKESGKLEPIILSSRMFSADDEAYLKGLRREWSGKKAADICGDCSDKNWHTKLTHIRTGAVKYFTEPWVAAMFINYFVIRRSSKKLKGVNTTMKEMARNPNNFAGYRCEIIV